MVISHYSHRRMTFKVSDEWTFVLTSCSWRWAEIHRRSSGAYHYLLGDGGLSCFGRSWWYRSAGNWWSTAESAIAAFASHMVKKLIRNRGAMNNKKVCYGSDRTSNYLPIVVFDAHDYLHFPGKNPKTAMTVFTGTVIAFHFAPSKQKKFTGNTDRRP